MRTGLGGIDSVAIIGGTSEIGLAIASELRGDRLLIAGRNPESAREAAGGLPLERFVDLDVGDPTTHESAVDLLFEDGDLDVVVLAAGVLNATPDIDQIGEMAIVNGAGSISLLASIGRRLEQQGHGHLVVLSSIAIVRPRPSNYWYGASKAGIDFAALGLAEELKGSGVWVNLVRPGFVHTKMTEGMHSAPFACHPEDVARSVAAAVRENVGGVIWVPGVLRWVSYVLRWLPRTLLHRLDR